MDKGEKLFEQQSKYKKIPMEVDNNDNCTDYNSINWNDILSSKN